MKKRSVQLASLVAVVLVLLIAVRAAASGEPETSVKPCRYFYQLTPVADSETEFVLSVDRTAVSGRPLHGGYITLAAKDPLSFTPDAAFNVVTSSSGGPGQDGAGAGSTSGGLSYLSFGWLAREGSLPDADTSRQVLGLLTVSAGTELLDIELLPWPETDTGSAQLSLYQQEAQSPNPDPELLEAYLTDIQSIWRIPELSVPMEGYYQGYFAPEGTGEIPEPSPEEPSASDTGTEASDTEPSPTPTPTPPKEDPWEGEKVDLTPGWYGFRIGAYAPERPVEITLYEAGTANSAQPVVIAKASHAFAEQGSGTYGHFRGQIDFKKLIYYSDTDVPLGEDEVTALLNGRCDLVVSKPSHASCTFENLQFTEGVCEMLLGVSVELPCGNVNGDKDGMIRQDDRADLTAPGRYGTKYPDEAHTDPTAEPCDLDGDHRVDQTDLAILIAPANYGKENFTYNFEG